MVPLADPVPPLAIVIQVALLIVDQAQADVTLTVPVAPADPTLTLPGEIVAVPHDEVSMKVFDVALGVDPPGPLADTTDV